MEKTVLYILSTNYAGSHFLSLLIGSHSRGMHLGEIRHMRRPERAHRNGCTVCDPPESCPLSSGIGPENIDDVYDRIYENTDHRSPLLVDTSKKIAWCQRFVGQRRFRMRYVHLIRDPRALVRRWLLSYTELRQKVSARWGTMRRIPRHALSVLFASEQRVYLYKWLQQNMQITEFLEDWPGEHILLTSRDLALNQEREVRRITEWLGLQFEPGQLEYWNQEHHGSQKPHYEWVKKDRVRHFDVRWKTFLSESFQRSVVRNRELESYLERLDLQLADDGLLRLAEPAQISAGG